MSIKFFWLYIGSLLACSVTLMVLVKKFSGDFAGSGNKPYWYGLLSSIIVSGVAFAATFASKNLFTVFWIFTAIFIVFGIIHMNMTHKKYFTPEQQGNGKALVGEIFYTVSILFFIILVFSSLQYFLKDREFLFYPMLMSGLGFFLPLLFVHTFAAAYIIPPAEFNTWYYPVHQPINLPDENANERLLVIGFELGKKESDEKRTYFRAKAPEGMPLGELYYHFINDYNELNSETQIDFTTKNDEPYEWWFRRKPKWYESHRVLDPKQTVKENAIKENTVIICERVPVTP